MKSKIPDIDYIELPLKIFLKRYPNFIFLLPSFIDLEDDNYIVRFKNGIIEFGYTSDDWTLKQS